MLKLKLQYFGHLTQSWLIGKDLDAGKDWGRRKWGWQRIRWLDGIINWWVWASSGRWWKTGKPGVLQSMGSQGVAHDWAAEQQLSSPHHLIYNSAYLVQFNRSVVSDSLRPHRLQHARLSCPSPVHRAYSNSCPPSQWCHFILCRLLLLLPSIFPSISIFSSESVLCIRWQKYWSFSFSISLSSECSELISFRID